MNRLNESKCQEIKALRQQDPKVWTYRALAWKFGKSESLMERICNNRYRNQR